MNPLFAAALEVQRFSAVHGWRSCVIGGLAVQRWGEPRLTLDVDCTILTGFGEEPGNSGLDTRLRLRPCRAVDWDWRLVRTTAWRRPRGGGR